MKIETPENIVTFQITREDIRMGISLSACYSPVASALQRELGKRYDQIKVGSKSIRFFNETGQMYLNIKVPERLGWWITCHDYGTPVYPSDFIIDLNATQSGIVWVCRIYKWPSLLKRMCWHLGCGLAPPAVGKPVR